ncbi:MAG: hypothetical protein Q9227_003210 [Pyrenula ochraceoflavens]
MFSNVASGIPPPQVPRSLTSIPPLRIGQEQVFNSQTNFLLFTIDRSKAHGSFSDDSLLTVVRTANGLPVGTARYHTLNEDKIDITSNGRCTVVKHDPYHKSRFSYTPTFAPGTTWWWDRPPAGGQGGLRLTDAKKGVGRPIASLAGGILVSEPIGLTEMAMDEILMTAITVQEWRRRKGEEDAQTIEAFSTAMEVAGGGA